MQLIYTWSELKAVQDRIAVIREEADAITERCIKERRARREEERQRWNSLWDEYHSLELKRDGMRKQVIPEVGIPCTVHWYSDRSGGFVEKVLSPKTVQVKCDGLYSCTKIFTYRKNGHWVEKGTTSRDWGTLLTLGYKSNYYDESF